jgi:hypothetical protein
MSNPAGIKYTFPAADSLTASAALMCVPVAAIPFLRRFFDEIQQPSRWATREDWYRAYQVFAEMEAELMSGCLTELVEGQNRLYRLLDTALNGTVYSASGDSPPVITPAIPAAPPAADLGGVAGMRRSLNAQVGLLRNLANGNTFDTDDNQPVEFATTEYLGVQAQLRAMQGTIDAGWFGIGGHQATITDIVTALRIGAPAQRDRITSALQALQAGGSAATIFGTVEDLFADVANGLGEGAVLATLIASSMAQAAMMGLQAGQLDSLIAALNRVVASLDGGAEPRPNSNVLAELAGVNEKLV